VKIPTDLQQDYDHIIAALKTETDEDSRRVLTQMKYYIERIAELEDQD
jgi:hypothetical protein